jgi:hypothetical protein
VDEARATPNEHSAAKLAHNVVKNLLDKLYDKSHFIFLDNYFSSIDHFKELISNDTFAISKSILIV